MTDLPELQALYQAHPTAAGAVRLAAKCCELHDYRRAEGYYKEAIALEPNDAALHVQLGELYAEHLQQEHKAHRHFKRAHRLEPECEHALVGLGNYHTAQNAYDAAIYAYTLAIAYWSGDEQELAKVYLHRARCRQAVKRFDLSTEDFEIHTQYEPRSFFGHLGCLENLVEQRDWQKAVALCLRLFERFKASKETIPLAVGIQLYEQFGLALLHTGLATEAVAAYAVALNLAEAKAPHPGMLHYLQHQSARALVMAQRWQEALKAYDKAIALDPGCRTCREEKADLLHEFN